MLKKFLLGFLVITGFGFFFSESASAAVDISLEDDVVNKEVSVVVNSNESYIDGLDFYIAYSEDIEIDEVVLSDGYCTFSSNFAFANGKLSIECLNDVDTEMDGVLATINYTTDSEDYFLYVDEENIDLGSLTLGTVENINKPDNIVFEDEVEEDIQEEELSNFNTVTEFLRDNSLYVLAGVIAFIAILTLVVATTSKKQ